MDVEKNKDLDTFLSRVDEIESIIKGLASSDENVSKLSAEKADALMNTINSDVKNFDAIESDSDIPILKTGVDRAVVNTDASKKEATMSDIQKSSVADSATFMAALEKDCQERAERKKQMKKEAERIKNEGNVEFANGNYEKALSLYRQATEKLKDWDILHTNLAQTNIRLGRFEAALEDCTWAFRVNANCLKAFILQGKAYFGLKQYEKAIESYEEAVRIVPEKEAMINTYIAQVKAVIESEAEERTATQVFDDGDTVATGLVEVLKKLNRKDQPLMFYSGGLQIIKSLLKDVNSKALLRLNGGLDLMKTHPVITKCFNVSPDLLTKLEADVCSSYFEMLQSACNDNDSNRTEIIEKNNLSDILLKYTNNRYLKAAAVQTVVATTLQLMSVISETETGRRSILTKYDILSLVSCWSTLLISPNSSFQSVILVTLNNFTLEKKFRSCICSDVDDKLIQSIESLLDGCDSTASILTSLYILTNLAIETYHRQKFASRLRTWKCCFKVLKKFSSSTEPRSDTILSAVLGVMANMALEKKSGDFSDIGMELCILCGKMLAEKNIQEDEMLQRLCLLLSRLLTSGTDTFIFSCQDVVVPAILEILKAKGLNAPKSCASCLASCTKFSDEARKRIVDSPKGLKAVADLLKSENEFVVGNAALCLSHCAELSKVCKAFVKTNIIMDLLVLARDQMKPTVQHNCAILIAKLCQGDQRHLERLRELHGLEILNTVLHHVKE